MIMALLYYSKITLFFANSSLSSMTDKDQIEQAQNLMRDVIQRVAVGPDRGRDISREEAQRVMGAVLDGMIDEVQTAVFLIALRMKRESLDEFRGLFDGLQAGTNTMIAPVPELWCLADPFDGYKRHLSMTPFLPALLSACGLPTIMHGVESVGPKHGVTAHKVLKLAGMEVSNSQLRAIDNLSNVEWAYVDQCDYAPKLAAMNGLRDRLVKRTAITTLERLLMPIRGSRCTHLVLGYVHKAYPEIYATISQQAGYNSSLLIKGVEGGLAPALNKPLRRFFFDTDLPEVIDAEKELLDTAEIFGHTSTAMSARAEMVNDDKLERNASSLVFRTLEVGLDVLQAKSGSVDLARDSLVLATANVLFAHGRADTLTKAVEKARHCLDNGSAYRHFQALTN